MLDRNNIYNTKKNMNGGFLFKTKKKIKSNKTEFVNKFINHVFTYKPSNSDIVIDEDIKTVNTFLGNIGTLNKEYIRTINSNKKQDRRYRRLPMPSMIKKIYTDNKKGSSINFKKIYDEIYLYYAVMAIFDNLLHNMLQNPVSEKFSILADDMSLIAYGLNNIKDNASKYLDKVHNNVFKKIYKATIDVNKLTGPDSTYTSRADGNLGTLNKPSQQFSQVKSPNTLFSQLLQRQLALNTEPKSSITTSTVSIVNIDDEYQKLIKKDIMTSTNPDRIKRIKKFNEIAQNPGKKIITEV